MPTFLVTSKMSPALAARIEASVQGRRSEGASAKWGPRVVSLVRFGLIGAVVGVVCLVVHLRRQDRRELEEARQALLDAVRVESAQLTPEDQGTVARAESLLVRSAGAYEGDFVADELRPPGALAAALGRPTIYLRGALGPLGNPSALADAASASVKDPLLVCLLDPPTSRAEKVLLGKVRAAYSNGAEQHSPNVRRLHDADVGLPFLLPRWAEGVASAQTPEEVARLRNDFERAPVKAARLAAKSRQLLFVMDEPGEAGVPAELDGERPHPVRVELVELASSRVLLRMRKRVDPSWISTAKRAEYASGLDGCALAIDVHEAVKGSK